MQSVFAAPSRDLGPGRWCRAAVVPVSPRPPAPPAPARLPAASASAALHVAALYLVCLVAVKPPAPSPEPPSVTAIFTPPAPVEQQLAAEALPRPEPVTQVDAVSAPAPLLMAAPQAEIHVRRAAARPVPHSPTPAARETQTAAGKATPPGLAPASPLAPSVSAPLSHDALAALEARIRQSVQDALVYPSAARMMHREGRTQIAFDYTDGAVDTVAVAVSSRMAMLDTAALSAVRRAALPRAPHEIGGRKLAMLVWVTFTLEAQE